MGDKTGIAWTDATWNPVTGCDKVSPGCAHCYAETVADRFWAKQYPFVTVGRSGNPDSSDDTIERPRRFTDVWCHEDRLDQPLRWKRPRRVFVNSMSDLFHVDVSEEFISRMFAVMALTPHHTFQILTKRHERMQDYLETMATDPDAYCFAWAREYQRADGQRTQTLHDETWPLKNVWVGVSVENQHWADIRIPYLLRTPAAIRFVSYEPALGPVNFRPEWLRCACPPCAAGRPFACESGKPHLHWGIFGGESRQGSVEARPCDLEWGRSALKQFKAAGVPFFVKQLGGNPYIGDGGGPEILTQSRPNATWYPEYYELDIDKGHGGDMAEWPEDLRVREYPNAPIL